ncbi:MAG TPA: Rne/Rng family ribonuclease [Thermodesulfobacteriota bacterium]|nr:Rne/Rng family ribonuclease [Thermodesulfobacteriota bacterium]
MSNELIINATSYETRVALLENGIVSELFIERSRDLGIFGNIYKGRVVKILPGMQAAFVDIGLERTAFLYVTDVREGVEEYDVFMKEGDEGIEFESELGSVRFSHAASVPIEDLLKEGQEVLVQVSKEPLGTKGARITSHISLAGRHLVFTPTVDHVGVSRRIENDKERKRLKDIVSSIRPPGTGFIVRTVSEGKSEEELRADMDYLVKLWDNIQKKKEVASAPSLIHSELNLTLRVIRDMFSADISRLVIDSNNEYEKAMEFVNTFMPKVSEFIELYERDEPIYDAYGIELEISRALGKRVWLKSGGYIIIDQTEALTAIDVNTGRYTGKKKLEDTVLKTNLEAVKEVAYQLRLRNLGGIIIIDFIDMDKPANREKVYNALMEALKKDKARTNILKISEFGLIEMTRKRVRESLNQLLCEPCPYCDGRGRIKSKNTICYGIFRAVRRESPDLPGEKILIAVNPEIADLLYDEESQGVEELERSLAKKIIIKARNTFHQEQYEITGI